MASIDGKRLLRPAKQVANQALAMRDEIRRAAEERLTNQLAEAIESALSLGRGEACVEIKIDDQGVARALLGAEGYVWSEPEPEMGRLQRNNGESRSFVISLTEHKPPNVV